MCLSPTCAAAQSHARPRRPAGVLGAHESARGLQNSEKRSTPEDSTKSPLEAFLPDPAEVRAVEPQRMFSAQEYRDKGFTGPIRLFSSAQASAVAAAFFRGAPLTNKQILSQRHRGQGPQTPPSTHPATWNYTLPMAKNDDLLNVAAEILGPDVVLWATVFWHKPPCSDGYIPWQYVHSPSTASREVLRLICFDHV